MILKNVEKKEKNTALFEVELDAAEFEAAVNAAYLKNRSNIYIPGFRKGKAPRAIVEGMYGREVFYQDAMDELAPKAFEFGLEESKLQTVGAPSISDVNVTEEKPSPSTLTASWRASALTAARPRTIPSCWAPIPLFPALRSRSSA